MQIGLSTCGKEMNEALFRSYRDAGIPMMEISATAEAYTDLDYKLLSDLSRQYGITLWSFHLPFAPFEQIDISRPELSAQTINYYETLIQKAAAIGIRYFIVHPSGEPIAEADRPARLACAKDSRAAACLCRKLANSACCSANILSYKRARKTCIAASLF